jgi:hypothetical protein
MMKKFTLVPAALLVCFQLAWEAWKAKYGNNQPLRRLRSGTRDSKTTFLQKKAVSVCAETALVLFIYPVISELSICRYTHHLY